MMAIGVSNNGWNPSLWPSYSGWSSIAQGARALSGSALSSQSLSSIEAEKTAGSVLATNSSSAGGAFDALSISPSAYSMFYSAENSLTQALGGSAVSPQTFFAGAFAGTQPSANPLLQEMSSTGSGTQDMTALLGQAQNSSLESAAPSYYLNTFNPYSYLGGASLVGASSTTAASAGPAATSAAGNLFNSLA